MYICIYIHATHATHECLAREKDVKLLTEANLLL